MHARTLALALMFSGLLGTVHAVPQERVQAGLVPTETYIVVKGDTISELCKRWAKGGRFGQKDPYSACKTEIFAQLKIERESEAKNLKIKKELTIPSLQVVAEGVQGEPGPLRPEGDQVQPMQPETRPVNSSSPAELGKLADRIAKLERMNAEKSNSPAAEGAIPVLPPEDASALLANFNVLLNKVESKSQQLQKQDERISALESQVARDKKTIKDMRWAQKMTNRALGGSLLLMFVIAVAIATSRGSRTAKA